MARSAPVKLPPAEPQATTRQATSSAAVDPTVHLTDEKPDTAKARVLELARRCSERKVRGLGIHGAVLDYSRANVMTPAQARAENETDGLASLSDNWRAVWIPESPPMDQRVPNGISLLINTKTGKCNIPKMR